MIQHFIITVLVIYGVHGSTRHNMIFSISWLERYFIKESGFIDYSNPDPQYTFVGKVWLKLSKALFDCTPCMASVYGTISFFIVEFPTQGLVGLPVWVFSMCGFNYLLNKLINR